MFRCPTLDISNLSNDSFAFCSIFENQISDWFNKVSVITEYKWTNLKNLKQIQGWTNIYDIIDNHNLIQPWLLGYIVPDVRAGSSVCINVCPNLISPNKPAKNCWTMAWWGNRGEDTYKCEMW